MLVGINFDRLIAERRAQKIDKISINNNIRVLNVQESGVVTKQSDKAIDIQFEFSAKFEPNVGQILITGTAIYVLPKKKTIQVLKEWKKNKKLPDDIVAEVLTALLARANVEAILLAKEVNLPPTIPMPKVEPPRKKSKDKNKDNSYIG